MYRMKLVIENSLDLQRAGQLVSWLNRPTVDQVLIALPWIVRAEQQRSAKTLKFYFNDCGCLWGSPAFVAAGAVCLLFGPWDGRSTWAAVGVSLLVAVAAALMAKLAALAWSRRRLKVLLHRMAPAEDDVRRAA